MRLVASMGAGLGIAFTIYSAWWWPLPKSLWSFVFWALTTGLLVVAGHLEDRAS